MFQRIAFLSVICVTAACTTTPTAVGNDAYATVALGAGSDAMARLWCRPYGKVPQLRDQDTAHRTATYDCIIEAPSIGRTGF